MSAHPLARDRIATAVTTALAEQPVVDMHTHLYPPAFGTPAPHPGGRADPAGLMLYGIDELLTYHYLVAELFRVVPRESLSPERFFALDKPAQADLVWRHLFVERSPLSEACRGVLTVLARLGIDTSARGLGPARAFFAAQDPDAHVDRVMQLANVSSITMTNDPLDDNERARWLANPAPRRDPRFRAVVRIDSLLLAYPTAAKKLHGLGYHVHTSVDDASAESLRRFLREWIDRTEAAYVAASLPPEFVHPSAPGDALAAAGQGVLERVVLPVCAERRLPFAMMIGSRRGVNPALRDAGDMGGRAEITAVTHLCRAFPDNKFLVTMLARENQHELCVAARKFGNLMVFGCWWFLNVPSMIEEITRMRLELLGTSFVPQHSDARVLDQLVYKWEHSRRVIARVLASKYEDLADAGWAVHEADIRRDARLFLQDNFAQFLER